jgi:hypothetical protein
VPTTRRLTALFFAVDAVRLPISMALDSRHAALENVGLIEIFRGSVRNGSLLTDFESCFRRGPLVRLADDTQYRQRMPMARA